MRQFMLMLSCIICSSALSAADPAAYRIPMARPMAQPNAFSCGPASATMVLDWTGCLVDVAAVQNVARLTSNGTAVGDVLRTGHFSRLSSAQGIQGPVAPLAGYPGRDVGLAVLAHAQASSWLPQVKSLIAQNIPVLMLMQFTADDAGGHYRVAMGYDDQTQTMWFADPWCRGLKGQQDAEGFQPFSYQDVETCWTYTGYNTSVPHWGAIFVPWTIGLSYTRTAKSLTILATTTYPCPAPFSSSQFPARNSLATLTLPVGWTATGSTTHDLGVMTAGRTVTTSWVVTPGAFPALIRVHAEGLVSASLPATGPYDGTAGQGQIFPAYTYTDAIGATSSVLVGVPN